MLEVNVKFDAKDEELIRLSKLAEKMRVSNPDILRLALEKGAKFEDLETLEADYEKTVQKGETVLLEQNAVQDFGKLNSQYTALRYRYYELYSENRILTMNLCGKGLGQKYQPFLERYIFAENDRIKRPLENDKHVT